MAKRNSEPWLTGLAVIVTGGLTAAALLARAQQGPPGMTGVVLLGLVALPVAVNAVLTNLRIDSGRSLLEAIVERRRIHRAPDPADVEDSGATATSAPGGPPDTDVERSRHSELATGDVVAAYHRGFLDGLEAADRLREADQPQRSHERLLTAAEWREIEADQHRSDIRFAAWLGAGGAVLAALVGGIFLVIAELVKSSATP